ncbi:helix-turn-helix domain-containing protein [Chitinophaga sp. Hz27]|uniref:helix-turn-helix domain-containing protein n=1 Tax=Chitinophaga sp. Hz27 TaxID=3347169 RepID=UPI0035DB596F
MSNTIHQGKNVKRFREMLGIKQDALAFELGDDWNQRKISLLESKETIEDNILEKVAKVLKVPVEAIQNFDEETAFINIQNNYAGSHTKGNNNVVTANYYGDDAETKELLIQLSQNLLQLTEKVTSLINKM